MHARCILCMFGLIAASPFAIADANAGPPTTQPATYLGIPDSEEVKFDAGPLRGQVKLSRVQEVTWEEFAKLEDESSKYEFRGKWLYFAVDLERDVRFDAPKAGQPISGLFTVTQRYRVALGSQPAGVPARKEGRLTDGPPLAELLAAIAVRLPKGWYIDQVQARKPGERVSVSIQRWPDSGKEFLDGRFLQIDVDLSSEDAGKPLSDVAKKINAITPHMTKGATTQPVESVKLLDRPSPDREVIVGSLLEFTKVHRNIDGPGHGFYYTGRFSDRRTMREEAFDIFVVFAPANVMLDIGKAMFRDRQIGPTDVLIVKRNVGNDHFAFQLFVPLDVLGKSAVESSPSTPDRRHLSP